MRRLGLVAAVLLLVGTLGACTFLPVGPAGASQVNANTSETTPVATGVSVPAGGTVWYDVYLSSSVRNLPLIYFELDPVASGPDLNLKLEDYTTGKILASSSSPEYFASGLHGLSVTSVVPSNGPAPQSLSVNKKCLSSCVIWRASASNYYLGIANPTASSVTVDVYAYGYDYTDSNEPNNASFNYATPIGVTTDEGAIETLGDNDYWQITSGSSLTFNALFSGTPVGLQADVYDSAQQYITTLYPGDSIGVSAGQYVRVYAANNYAGPSYYSGYSLTIN